MNNGLCLNPRASFTQNIGMDGSGVHCGETKEYEVTLTDTYPVSFEGSIEERLETRKKLERYFRVKNKAIIQVKKLIKRIRREGISKAIEYYIKKYTGGKKKGTDLFEVYTMKRLIKRVLKAIIPYGLVIYWNQRKRPKEGADFEWAMSVNERELFNKYVAAAHTYLEFGSGGSTIAALINTEGKVFSVESSKAWIEQMKMKYGLITTSIAMGRLTLIHADIGSTGEWGTPINDDKESRIFSKYSQEVFETYPEVRLSDVVLIDGRFRIACLLNTLIKSKLDTILMVHDFWNRPKYHIIKKYVDIIDGVDTLMICKRKNNVTNEEIRKEYSKYKNNTE